MAEFYKNIPIIDLESGDLNNDILWPKGRGFGLVDRDYELYPESMFASPSEMKIIPESEWDARFDEQEAQKSSLEHIYLSGPNGTPAFVNLDQSTDGYCWAYSTGHSVMLDRLKRNLTPIRLNPHSVGAIIKRGRNEGGWCGESAEFMTKVGIAVEGSGKLQWPRWSRDLRHDTPAMRSEMSKYRLDEQWVDLTQRVYDRNLTMGQVATSGFLNLPGPRDYSWWRHSVLGLRWVRIERGAWGQLILNSWKDFGRFGLAVLRGSKAICNGGLSIRTTTA